METHPNRLMPIGAELLIEGGVHFRVWAPRAQSVEVLLEEKSSQQSTQLKPETDGYFSGVIREARVNILYRYRLDKGTTLLPDPASRFQPVGPHGPSQVVDPGLFRWSDSAWTGPKRQGMVLYELHIGTFTEEGTWQAAAQQLRELASLGVTVLEIMPVADFPGQFGWGYDGVNLFAPTRLYGPPDDFRSFVDQAHAAGLGVILDVVYNHIGPDGNYLTEFSPSYFTDRYKNEWGEAINFDGPDSGPVRDFFLANAAFWIREYHLDGLRLDATQQIFDASPVNILAAIARHVREAAAGKETFIVAENEAQETRLVRSVEQSGFALDAIWNDDFHHAATVALTGKNPAYYMDYLGTPQEFIAAAKWGFLYQGQWYSWQKKRRGTPALDLSPTQFVTYLQNHDQIANSGRGLRIHQLTSPGKFKAMTALLLLGPGTPMLFQGQEFAASSPFIFFANHQPDLARQVAKGRAKFLAQFPALALPESQAALADPSDPQILERCRLDFSERERHADIYALHRDLLRLRREDPVFRVPRPRYCDGAVLSAQAFCLRFFDEGGDDRLLIINLGRDLHLKPMPEPLLAPPRHCRWRVHWSSEDLRYGGCGTPEPDTDDNWHIPGEAALVLIPGNEKP